MDIQPTDYTPELFEQYGVRLAGFLREGDPDSTVSEVASILLDRLCSAWTPVQRFDVLRLAQFIIGDEFDELFQARKQRPLDDDEMERLGDCIVLYEEFDRFIAGFIVKARTEIAQEAVVDFPAMQEMNTHLERIRAGV